MRVWIETGVEGAGRAAARGDVMVLVDALRSSVTITAALAAGARRVVPVQSVEEARSHLGRPGTVVAGEQGGVQVPDFDLGNSPTQILRRGSRIRGQTVILITSNGIPCIWAAHGVYALLVGSLPNGRAAARAAFHLAREGGADVTILAAGAIDEPAVEDDYAAAMLAGKLAAMGAATARAEPAQTAERVFREGPNGRRLSGLGYAEDVALCARSDIFQIVGLLGDEGVTTWTGG